MNPLIIYAVLSVGVLGMGGLLLQSKEDNGKLEAQNKQLHKSGEELYNSMYEDVTEYNEKAEAKAAEAKIMYDLYKKADKENSRLKHEAINYDITKEARIDFAGTERAINDRINGMLQHAEDASDPERSTGDKVGSE